MKKYIQTMLASKDISVPEATHHILENRWKGYVNYRKEMEELKLEASEMGLLGTYMGSWDRE